MLPEGLEGLLKLIKDEGLRRKVEELIEACGRMAEAHGTLGPADSPAGKSRHHSYPGGLVQHTLATAKLALAVADIVEEVYGWSGIDRDQLIAGAILHDIFKPLTYVDKGGEYDYSELGRRLDHLSLLIGEAYARGLPLDLLHILAAHHGEAGPIMPRTVEALIVHLADALDAKLCGEVQRAAQAMAKEYAGEELKVISAKDAFEIVQARRFEGPEGVVKAVRRMKERGGEAR